MLSIIFIFCLKLIGFQEVVSYQQSLDVPEHRLPVMLLVYECSEDSRLDEELIFAVAFVESSFRHSVVSKKGAVGVFQLMPVHDVNNEDLEEHTRYAIRYLEYLIIDKYEGDVGKGLRYYNGGWRAMESRDAYEYSGKVLKIYNKLKGS